MEIIAEWRYRLVIPRHGRMWVPGAVFGTRSLIPDLAADRALEQVVNVAVLPGIVVASYGCPMCSGGTGSRSAGVAATDAARGGVVSPGGVGFDIACGLRLLTADLRRDQAALAAPYVRLAARRSPGGNRLLGQLGWSRCMRPGAAVSIVQATLHAGGPAAGPAERDEERLPPTHISGPSECGQSSCRARSETLRFGRALCH